MRISHTVVCVASYPGLPLQLFSQPWGKKRGSMVAKKAARGGLGTRLPCAYTFVVVSKQVLYYSWMMVLSGLQEIQLIDQSGK